MSIALQYFIPPSCPKETNGDIGDTLMDILASGNISTVFQPIISLKHGGILGYEALSRGPKDSGLESPASLFDVARIYGKLWELEYLCRIKALENANASLGEHYIFINVDPDIINDEKFKVGFTKEYLNLYNINPEKVVLEITEKSTVSDMANFRKAIDTYKDQGYRIAVDDTGAGYSGLKLITDVHPHFIKLDMGLIRNIDKDGMKKALIKTFSEFCLVSDIKLIAEGIETIDELNTLIDIGIHYGQGYFIQKPLDGFYPLRPELIRHIHERNQQKSLLYYSRPSTVMVGDICRNTTTVDTSRTGAYVLDIFNSNPSIHGIPVVSGEKLAGLVMKDRFYAKLGTQYGFALFLNRSISLIMDKRPLEVDSSTTIDVVSKLAMTRSSENLYDYIVVTKDSNYYGIVTVKDLLEKTIELEVNYARHLNPLSSLPGNILIEHKLKNLVEADKPFTVLYIDIDNFKVYNDVYGFENGDRMLQLLGRILSAAAASHTRCSSFVGHIGGDDFVIAVDGYDVDKVCEEIIDSFEKIKHEFYPAEDFHRKYVLYRNRHGVEEQFGLVTLSIAGISNKHRSYRDIYELSEHASRVKMECKQIWDNAYQVE